MNQIEKAEKVIKTTEGKLKKIPNLKECEKLLKQLENYNCKISYLEDAEYDFNHKIKFTV